MSTDMHEPIEASRDAGGARLRLRGPINIFHAAALHAAALGALEPGGDVQVDCGELEHLDTSALQLLLALSAALRAEGRTLRLHDVPAGVQRYLNLAGLEAALLEPTARETAAQEVAA